MNEFVRAVFTGETLLQLARTSVVPSSIPAAALKGKTSSVYLTTAQIVGGMVAVLGERVARTLLLTTPQTAVAVAGEVMDDHIRRTDRDPKDLQVNLAVNVVKDVTLQQDLPHAKRYGFGEEIIRKCGFDTDFKYALKCALFDRKEILSPYLTITHYPPPITPKGVGSDW